MGLDRNKVKKRGCRERKAKEGKYRVLLKL
jgi:hypothetical protein